MKLFTMMLCGPNFAVSQCFEPKIILKTTSSIFKEPEVSLIMCTVLLAYLLTDYLVTPRNPQRCNSMIAKRSIQFNFYVSLFTFGVLDLVKYSIQKIPEVNLHVTKLGIF